MLAIILSEWFLLTITDNPSGAGHSRLTASIMSRIDQVTQTHIAAPMHVPLQTDRVVISAVIYV